MAISPNRCAQRPGRFSSGSDPFTARKQQALVVLLAQQLGDAQFDRADKAGSDRLWQEVAALEIEPERVIALLYGGEDLSNREALRNQDDLWLASQPQPVARTWTLRRLHLGRPRRPSAILSPA